MPLIVVGVLCSAIISAWTLSISPCPQKRSLGISDKDKAEITKDMLKRVLTFKKVMEVDAGLSDFDLLRKTQGGVVVSAVNIKPEWLPKMSGINFLVLTPQAIQRKADLEGDFMYLVFTRFDTKMLKVMVALDRIWAQAKDSNLRHLSGGGETYEYKKASGKWMGRFVEGWMS